MILNDQVKRKNKRIDRTILEVLKTALILNENLPILNPQVVSNSGVWSHF